MYGAHWYSLVASTLSEGDWASDVQFSSADVSIKIRFSDLESEANFDPTRLVWDTSYFLSPTIWFRADRYKNSPRLNGERSNAPKSYARRNGFDDVTFPSAKVLMWERFDTTRDTRAEQTFSINGEMISTGSSVGTGQFSPQWNNPEAEPTVATADGSVTRVQMRDLYELGQNTDARKSRTYTPTDVWQPNPTKLGQGFGLNPGYNMIQDGFEVGVEDYPGLYPAFFWATRDGVKGRDLPR